MYYILRKQIVLLITTCMFFASQTVAQTEIYRRNHDDLVYYFGLTLGYNYSFLHISKSDRFLLSDSIFVAEPGTSAGIAMGLMATGRLSDHFQIRTNPQLIIGGSKYISYSLNKTKPGEPAFSIQTLPATLVSFPIQIKFNSDRIGNFRTIC